jgi:hypothetical protein
MSSLRLNINCWVQGDDRDSVFELKISGTESVSALREAIKIKKKHSFQDVDADTLKLWKVSAYSV